MLHFISLRSMNSVARGVLVMAAVITGCCHAQELRFKEPESLGLSEDALSRITLMLRQEVDDRQIAGAVAAVVRNGSVGYFEAVGQQGADSSQPMRRDAMFRIASMTKAVTSVAIMQLMERGELSLDDPLSAHLSEFATPQVLASVDRPGMETVAAEREPTIHDLLTHRSGLTYGWFGPEKLDALYRQSEISDFFTTTNEQLADRVHRISHLPLKFQPGTAWDYGVSTDVLGRVVEEVSGQTLNDYFIEHIFLPLNMTDTHFTVPQEKIHRLAGLCTIKENGNVEGVDAQPATAGFLTFSGDYCLAPNQFYSGGAGLVSTTADYIHFLQMLLDHGTLNGKTILQPTTVAMMTKNQIGDLRIPFPGHGDGFGFGFGVLTQRGAAEDDASPGTYSWGGIFDSYFWVDPKERLIGVLMTQVFPNSHEERRAGFKKLVYESLEDRVHLVRSVRDKSAGGIDCFRVTTPHAVYYLDRVGAGLSSMIDRDGIDWINFHPEPGSGAAGEYRGFPNAVFREAGSYFHATNSGTDPCVTFVEEESPGRVVIGALSGNGMWEGRYTFTPESCTFTVTKKPDDHNYWVLYEGTPGGKYESTDWWMTSESPQKHAMDIPHEGDIPAPEWIAFGDAKLSRVIVLHHEEDDTSPDRFYQMENKMTVFGFGRHGMEKHLSDVPRSFTIQFVESTDHGDISESISQSVQNRLAGRRQVEGQHLTADQRRDALQQFALTHSGDPQRGRQLFFEDLRTRCLLCHRIEKRGGLVGPDLSRIGGKFDRPHLIESLIEPSKQIVEGYRTSLIIDHSGKLHAGIVKSEDDRQLALVDQQDNLQIIKREEIDERVEATVSLMPTGLPEQLTPQEFTDLVAYLETLRTAKPAFGSAVKGPIALPDGFEIRTIATGISGATAMEVAPDGRIFVCEQNGRLRVIRDGKLLERPFVTLPVEHYWERGLIGVTVAPTFPMDPWVYVVYVVKEPFTHHRVSRFRADGDVAAVGSEQILLEGDDQSLFGGNVPAGHQGGAIHFGNDGMLYIGIGEQTAKTPAQRMDALQGKLLRINPDGSVPEDNPFVSKTKGKYQSIWAKGCRNPFTFAVNRSTGDILINDVGGKYEEINRGIAGADYGWPVVDHGRTTRPGVTGPIHIYPQASISGGDFSVGQDNWPSEFRNKYFFADFVHGWIKYLDPNDASASVDFAAGLRRVVDLRFAPDGSLYVLLRNAWVVDDKFEGSTGALMQVRFREEPAASR